ncbi:TonB-dependent receptor [Aurantiacibacter poecillastricola]|uniref:TonB-dependent receptor n=1 Tax=Aurantiacibacter poecillastricola TaxID=3064385 RepID=UPI0027402DD6|nr:TonB-dependent siderophore receptor [Aurantiacibacter sp. 219JJ12-13]MDP5261193.1 TonB-dependent siderophore receptor [Aurantiacibacter sp. 219JJ12-13]
MAGVALVIPAAALAETEANADAQRDYLPGNIIVTGELDGYVNEDGSTATKTPTPIIDVPQSVTVITADQLEDQGVTSLNDALRFVPGVSLETGEGHRDEVFIRGQETTADFYLDGLRDDAQYYRPLYNVERVEVLKGANALIFGRGAGGGAINRVARVAEFDMPEYALGAQVDTFGAFALTGDANLPASETLALRISGTYEEFDNHRDVYDGRFVGISPTLTAQLGPDTRLYAFYTYDDDERVVDRGLPALGDGPLTGYDETFFGDSDYNFSDVEVHIARTRLEHDFSEAFSANASLLVADYDKFYSNIVPAGIVNGGTDVRLAGYESGTDRKNVIGQVNLVGQFDTGGLGHTLLLGAEVTSSDTDSVRNQARFNNGADTSVVVDLDETIVVPAFTLSPQRASTSELSTFSLYAQEQLDIGILQLVAGLRFDRFDITSTDFVANFDGERVDENVSPRFGAILKPRANLSVYASYATSFLPSVGDQFTVLSQQDEALEPEEYENLELGVKYAPHRDLLLTGAIFRLTRSNTPSVDPVTNLTTLVGESEVEGFELGLVGKPVEGLSLSLGYAYLDGEITDSADRDDIGTVLQQVPEHQITAWARYDLTDRLGFGAGLIHQSDQFASNSNNVVLPSYTRVDAAIFFEATDRLTLQANVENLFDEDYYPSAHGDNNIQPGAPLNASFGARLNF